MASDPEGALPTAGEGALRVVLSNRGLRHSACCEAGLQRRVCSMSSDFRAKRRTVPAA